MERIILDELLRARLNGLDQQIEICDESGRRVGHFLPERQFLRLLVEASKAQVTDEELERRLREPGERSLEEIWERLHKS